MFTMTCVKIIVCVARVTRMCCVTALTLRWTVELFTCCGTECYKHCTPGTYRWEGREEEGRGEGEGREGGRREEGREGRNEGEGGREDETKDGRTVIQQEMWRVWCGGKEENVGRMRMWEGRECRKEANGEGWECRKEENVRRKRMWDGERCREGENNWHLLVDTCSCKIWNFSAQLNLHFTLSFRINLFCAINSTHPRNLLPTSCHGYRLVTLWKFPQTMPFRVTWWCCHRTTKMVTATSPLPTWMEKPTSRWLSTSSVHITCL